MRYLYWLREKESRLLTIGKFKIVSKILVSVVCTAYNHEKYIRDCIEGFLMQKTDFSYEVLINEDASTDSTAEIIKEYEEQFPDIIKPIYQKENQYSKKVGLWRTILFPRAKGKYIAICEGDDYWTDPLKLQRQVDFLESNPDFSLCFHNAWVVFQNSGHKVLFKDLRSGEYTGEDILKEWTVPTASVVFRKDQFDKRHLSNPRFLFSDIILFLTLAESGKLMAFSQPMSAYRRHEGGISFGRNNVKRLKLIIQHHKEIGKAFSRKYRTVEKKNIGNAYFQLSNEYLRRNDIKCFPTFFSALYYTPKGAMLSLVWNICFRLGLKHPKDNVFR